MSLLQAVARRSIHQCRNESSSLIRSSHRSNRSIRASSNLLHILGTKSQSNDGSQVRLEKSWVAPRRFSHTEYVTNITANPMGRFPYSSIELFHFPHSGKRHFSSPTPQTESQHISSISDDNSQIKNINLRDQPPTGPAPPSDKATPSKRETPSSEEIKQSKPSERKGKESSIIRKAQDSTMWAIQSLISLLAKTPGVLWFYMTHPVEFRKKLGELKEMAVKEAHHYWMGSKVSFHDILYICIRIYYVNF